MDKSYFTLIAIQAALKAGELLRQGQQTHFHIASKSTLNDLVTEMDKRSEECIIEMLREHFPSHGILAEESGALNQNGSEYLWVIDPLDGTVNYAHRVPLFCVSIALGVAGEVHTGVVYNPMVHELFVAEKGKGAFCNGTRLQVSSNAQLERAFLVTGFPYDVEKNPMHCIDRFAQVVAQGIPVRRFGSAALDLAYVAAGRFDAYWELHLKPWDSAAGKLLVEEAGGKVTQYDGSKHQLDDKTVLATNGRLHDQMIVQLNQKELWIR